MTELSTPPPDPVQNAMDLVVESNVAAIRRALDAVEIPAPAYALGIGEAEDPEGLDASIVVVGLDVDRQQAISELTPYRAFRAVWRIWDFAIELDTAPPEQTPALDEAREMVIAHVNSVGLMDPSRVVFNQIALRLTQEPPLSPRTDDFLAFAFDEGRLDALLANLNASATPAVAATLRANNLLPDSWKELEGAPRFP